VEETLLVLDVTVRTTNSGDPYTVLNLGNSLGQLQTAPFWLDQQEMVTGVQRGHIVQAIGEVTTFRDQPQLSVNSLRLLPSDAVDPTTLLPSVGPVDRYWATIDGWRNEIAGPRLKGVLNLFYEDADFRRRYEQCPAAVRGHHSALGGLLMHTTEVAAIARAIARVRGANSDLLLAGVLLHDIGKLESYRWDGIFEYTDAGRLVGHVVLGALMLERRLNEEPEPPCTTAERHTLLHLILSHHGQLEFGSPVRPMTLEAEALHWADNASAKTASLAEALQEAKNFPEGATVSTPQWTLDRRRVYRDTCDWGVSSGGEEPQPEPPGDQINA
jgi:3'-5' exoribonuclease